VVLFGGGNLGRKACRALAAAGVDVAAFADNDEQRWGTQIDGIPVLAPPAAARRFGQDGVFVVTIWRAEGGHRFLETREALTRLGCRRVESFVPVFWAFPAQTLPHITIDAPGRVLEQRDAVLQAASLWADERSLREYVAQVRWRLTGDFSALEEPEGDQYFASGVVALRPDEVYVDCGAFTGDTLSEVARRLASWRAYHAFEPDGTSFAELEKAVAALPPQMAATVKLHRLATSDVCCRAALTAPGTAGATLCANGEESVDCAPLDDVLAAQAPTFIKMDVEGAEAATIRGAKTILRRHRPLLAIAAYHQQADVWSLPLLVAEECRDYRFYLRPHVAEGFELVVYAVPSERAL
jgi:FkbM family methyltransferase